MSHSVLGRAVLVAGLLALCVQAAYTQQLSIRRYDLRDGLAHSRVAAIHQDRKGYLWFGTWEGLSRFDGYSFTNYDTRDGLGYALINAITEDRRGRLWVATNSGGVSRLIDDPRESVVSGQSSVAKDKKRPTNDGGQRRSDQRQTTKQTFESFRVGDSQESNRVNALVFHSDNNLWCPTDDGLYRAALDQTGTPKFEVVVPHKPMAISMAALADRRGRLWFGLGDELIEVVEGQIIKYGPADEVGYYAITSIVEDHEGRLLLANSRGVFEFIEPKESGSRGRWNRLPIVLQPGQNPLRMLADSNGALWIGTNKGLIKWKEGQNVYTTAHGVSDDSIHALDEDRDGNLWIGTVSSGVCKLSGEAIVSFTRVEGLPSQYVGAVVESRQGHIYASTSQGLVEIVGGKAVTIQGSQAPPFNGVGRRLLQDVRGNWWIGTDQGLFRFEGPTLQLRRGNRFGAADGITDGAISSIYEESSSKVWISAGDRNLYYFDPAQTGRPLLKQVPLRGTPLPSSGPIAWMVSDRAGALWVGAQFGLVGRVKNGTVGLLQPTSGLPEIEPRALFVDSRGWIWIGLRNKGVSVTKDPAAETPEFANYSTAHGLASDTVWAIGEDDLGRIYLGTFKGLDRLDPVTDEIGHFTTTDGLAGDVINHCAKDSRGNVWVATATGLSKLNPRVERVVKRPPPIYLSRVQVAGEDLSLAETGTVGMTASELPASRNNLLIEYVGLSFQGERELKYQYKLEGADADWSAPSEQRSVNYARLAPGSYRFLVRAINQRGIASAEPACSSFASCRQSGSGGGSLRLWRRLLLASLT